MTIYVYKHKYTPGVETTIGSVTIPANGSIPSPNKDPILEGRVGRDVDRYVDGLLDNSSSPSTNTVSLVDQTAGLGKDDNLNRTWGGQRTIAIDTSSLATGSAIADSNHPGVSFVTSIRLKSGTVSGGVVVTDGSTGPVIGYASGAVSVNQQIILDGGNAVVLQNGLYINATGSGSCVWSVLGGTTSVN